jgi:Tfp pilus assembly protein PilX
MLRKQDGVALLVAVALTMILSAMALGIVTLSITEKGINRNQKSGLQALYNADAAIEVAKQQMTAFSQAKMESLRAEWPGTGPIIVAPETFFPDSGLSYASEEFGCEVRTVFTFVDSGLATTSQTFNFRYVSTASGEAYTTGSRAVISEGNLRLSASRGSFSDFLIFTHVHFTPDGSQIWFHTTGYFDGRVHSNGKMRFAYFPTFEDLVTQVPSAAAYYNEGHPVDLDADRNGTRDVPNFYGGFDRGVAPIPLPSNSFCQERAALGYAAADTTPVPLAQKRSALGLDPGDPSPVPPGIYVPNDGSAVTGGIYIAGDADECRLSVDGDGNQNYTITDENGITKRIVIDTANMRTEIHVGASTTELSGLPRGIMYATGGIDNLGGGDRVGDAAPVAVGYETQLTITAVDDITVDRDITCQDMDASSCVLGLYSSGGDVRIATDAPDDIMLDTFVMATGGYGAFTVDDYKHGDYRGQVHLRGGVVQRYYGPFGTFTASGNQTGYGRDFRYDRRGISPPYYPTTTLFNVDQPEPHVLVWREA